MGHSPVMLITGTSSGIGKYFVKYYTKKGFRVVGCSRRAVDHKIKDYQHFCLDVSDENVVKEMFGEITKVYERLDVLINNAGIVSMNYALLTPLQTVRKLLETNFIGTILFCREAVSLMSTGKYGRIVNVSSIAVPLSAPGSSGYGASKAAGEQYSRVLAKEVASYGITVNTVALSFVKNSGMTGQINEDIVTETLNKTILRSPLELDDVVHAVDFFISPESKMVTNQILYLGGL